jgi:hypothetical protein
LGDRRGSSLPRIEVLAVTVRLFANPYDITAKGFYFSSIEDFTSQYEDHLPTEEYEIDFIDGTHAELALFNAMKVSQASLDEYFEIISDLDDDDMAQVGICYLLENGIASDTADAVSRASDLTIFEGSLKDYAWEYLDECVFTKETPNIFRNYFDVDAFARDLDVGGDVATFDWCGRHFVVSGA